MTGQVRLAASVASLALLSAAGVANAQEPVMAQVESLVVTGRRAEVVLEPGGVSVLNTADLQAAALPNAAEVLKFVPGLFAQASAGGESTRLSIRGSGRGGGGFTWGDGIQILKDGLPISTPYGNPYESIEPNAYREVQVFKGANAFEYGAFSLGGAINFIEHTGYTADPLFLRAEGGSYGYNRQQVSSGQVIGKADYYASYTHFSTRGYLDNTTARSNRFIANVGYRFNDKLDTRFYFSWARQRQHQVNAVTLFNLENNPRANTGTRTFRDNYGTYVFSNKTRYVFDENSSIELSLGYQKPPIYGGVITARSLWDTQTLSGQLKYQRKDQLFGDHESRTTVAVLFSKVLDGSKNTIQNGVTGARLGSVDYSGSNNTVLVSNETALRPDLWLQLGVAALWLKRGNVITNTVAAGVDPRFDKTYEEITPRVGLRYDITPRLQVYGNWSRLVEAPGVRTYAQSLNSIFTGYITAPTTIGGVVYRFDARNLQTQTGNSYEAGFRGSTGRLKWEIGYYREQIRGELLTTYSVLPNVDPLNPNGLSYTRNAAPTIHEGLEVAAEAVLWREGETSLSLRQAYTWGSFRFVDKAPLQDRMPGLPRSVYQAELTFEHASGFYLKAGVDHTGSYPVDFANQADAPAYTLFGAAVGYVTPNKKWRFFIDGQNLGNKHYVAFTSTVGVATASSAVYTPGIGRNIIGGVSYAF